MPAAARWRTGSRRPASGSSSSSAATGCRARSRTGTPRPSSSTTGTSRKDTWYDQDGKAFQPQIHYFVGGATKFYGAALYRLRRARLRRAQAPRRDLAGVADRLRRLRAVLRPGRAALPGPRRPRRGSDRAPVERSLPLPAGLARAAHPAAVRRPDAGRAAPVPLPLRASCSTRPTRPLSTCIRCATCDGFACLVHAKSDAEVIAVRPALQHDNVTLLRNAHVRRLETDPSGATVTSVVADVDGAEQRFSASVVVVSAGAANSAKLLLASANDKHPNGLANGSDQVGRNYVFHNSRAFLADLDREERHPVPEDAGAQRLLLRRRRLRLPDGQRADGRQVVRADVPRREADRDRAGADVRPRRRRRAGGRLLAVRPRTCPTPTTG